MTGRNCRRVLQNVFRQVVGHVFCRGWPFDSPGVVRETPPKQAAEPRDRPCLPHLTSSPQWLTDRVRAWIRVRVEVRVRVRVSVMLESGVEFVWADVKGGNYHRRHGLWPTGTPEHIQGQVIHRHS